MSLDKGQISADLDKALSAIASANDLDSLKQIKIDYIGDKLAGVLVVGVALPQFNKYNEILKKYIRYI